MSKKAQKTKAPLIVEEGQGKLVLISDTTCQDRGKIWWEGIYALLEKENLMAIEEEGTADGTEESENTLNDLANSFLHRIAAHPKVLPYNDMVRWVIESINVTDKAFFTANGRMLNPSNLKTLRECITCQILSNTTPNHSWKLSPRRIILNQTLSSNGDNFLTITDMNHLVCILWTP